MNLHTRTPSKAKLTRKVISVALKTEPIDHVDLFLLIYANLTQKKIAEYCRIYKIPIAKTKTDAAWRLATTFKSSPQVLILIK